MSPIERRAEWLLDALKDDDKEAADAVLDALDNGALRRLCLHLAKTAKTTPTSIVETVLTEACEPFGCNPADVLAGDRHREVTDARAVTCYAAYLLGVSAMGTGRQIGIDHSTVLHARSRVGTTPRLRAIAERIAAQLGWDREAA